MENEYLTLVLAPYKSQRKNLDSIEEALDLATPKDSFVILTTVALSDGTRLLRHYSVHPGSVEKTPENAASCLHDHATVLQRLSPNAFFGSPLWPKD